MTMPLDVYEVPGRAFAEDEKGIVTGSRKWKVDAGTLTASPLDIYAAVGVAKYAQHPDYPQCIARTPRLQQQEADGTLWVLEVEYSSAPFEASQEPGQSAQQPSNESNQLKPPELRPPVWSFTRKEVMRVLEKDAVTEVPVTNSAGFPYDPPIEVPSSNMLIRVDFWKPAFTFAELRQRWDRVNGAAWKGFPARTLRVNDHSAKSQYDKADGGGLLAYWNCSLELEHSETPWNPRKILDQGSVERYTDGGTLRYKQITDMTGAPIVAPLDGSGRRLAPGQPLVYRDVSAYKEADFTALFF